MPKPPFTQVDLDRVKDASYQLAMDAPKLVGEHPLFAVAALTMAACHAALMTDTSFTTLMELVSLHYRSAAVALAAGELEDQLGHAIRLKYKPAEEPS